MNDNEIFPKDTDKTYGLMEIVKGTSLHLEKKPEKTRDTYPNLTSQGNHGPLASDRFRLPHLPLFQRSSGGTGESAKNSQSRQSALVLLGTPGTPASFSPDCRWSRHSSCDHSHADPSSLSRPQSEFKAQGEKSDRHYFHSVCIGHRDSDSYRNVFSVGEYWKWVWPWS